MENKNVNVTTEKDRAEILKAMKEMCNGLVIAEGREKALIETIVGNHVTIEDFMKVPVGKDKHYYAIIFKEDTEHFYFSGSKLTELIDTFGDNCYNLIICHEPSVVTKNKHDFTPITVLGY